VLSRDLSVSVQGKPDCEECVSQSALSGMHMCLSCMPLCDVEDGNRTDNTASGPQSVADDCM